MRAVWAGRAGEAFVVRDVQALMPELAYTTVMTTLHRLAEKGLLAARAEPGRRARRGGSWWWWVRAGAGGGPGGRGWVRLRHARSPPCLRPRRGRRWRAPPAGPESAGSGAWPGAGPPRSAPGCWRRVSTSPRLL